MSFGTYKPLLMNYEFGEKKFKVDPIYVDDGSERPPVATEMYRVDNVYLS